MVLLLFGLGAGTHAESRASLIINEVFNSTNGNREWVEFLVTTDITLGALDSIWFGDASTDTAVLENSSRFDSTEILSNVSYFTSTSDIIRAGTLIVIGGNAVSSDFAYNPNLTDPNDHDSWNLTFAGGAGFNTSRPVNLAGLSDVVWISSAQPANDTDTSNFFSAVAYLNSTSPTGGGTIADYVTSQSATNPAFETIHTGTGGGYDGEITSNQSISNLGNSDINFANSEGAASLGTPNGGLNSTYISTLRAVPEPGTFIPLGLLLLGGAYFRWRKRTTPAPRT